MGEGLADNRPEGDADGYEWRTAPLWSIGLTAGVSGGEAYLHDGRARTLEEAILWHGGEGEKSKETFQDMPNADRVALIRGPRVETNKGRDPQSPFFIRGVLHSHPVSLSIGAIVTLILAIILPLAIVSAGLLLLSDLVPLHFSWVPKWLLAFPFSLPVVGMGYLFFGLGGSCRICGQKQFVPRACLKNTKAHHVRGLGYIVPVAVHMLLFKWFRCTYCGTPVRLKK